MEFNFTNVQSNEVEGMLTQAEIDLIQAVVYRAIKLDGLWQEVGTFALIGQKRGHSAQEILRFNLWEGKFTIDTDSTSEDLYSRTSDRATEMAVDELLLYPRKKLSCKYKPEPNNFGQLSSDYYHLGRPKAYAVVINAAHGRFLASVATKKDDLDIQILLSVAMAIGKLSNGDPILSESVERIKAQCDDSTFLMKIDDFLKSNMANVSFVPSIFFE